MKHSFLLFALLLTAVACSQKGSNVGLKVSNNFAFGGSEMSAVSGGGLIVWGKNDKGHSFGHTLESSDQINLQLPKGKWNFYAMAWDGNQDYLSEANTNIPFGGTIRCAESTATTIGGDSEKVELVLEITACNGTTFRGTSATFRPLQFNFCSSNANISSSSDLCTNTSSESSHKAFKAPVASYKVTAINFFNNEVKGDGISSLCVDATSGVKIPNLPFGGAGFPFKFKVEMFVGSNDCDATNARGAIVADFPNGFGADTAKSKSFPTSYYLYQYVEVTPTKVCENRGGTSYSDHPFAGGLGTNESPYLICSVPQWHKINSNQDFKDKSFKLQTDLDFNPYSKGFTLPTNVPANFECLDLGSNFLPLGYMNAVCSSGNFFVNNIEQFSGSLYGSGHTFKNLRLRLESNSHVALVAYAVGTGLKFTDLNFIKPEIGAGDRGAVLIGESEGIAGPTDIIIENIRIQDSEVEARTQEANRTSGGSVVGYAKRTTINKAWIKNGYVRGDRNYVGGVVGLIENSNIVRVSAEVDLENNSHFDNQYIGGIAGKSINTNFGWVKHEGGINSTGKLIGGIVGHANSGTNLQNFYTISKIHSSNQDVEINAGGIAGQWSSSGFFGPGYTLSHISTSCFSGCNIGNDYGSSSVAPSDAGKVYVLPEFEAGAPHNFVSSMIMSSIANIKTTAYPTALTNMDGDDWYLVNGLYPRFDFENHPCSQGINGTGNGTQANPFLICEDLGYYALSSATPNAYYKLMANVRLNNNGTLRFDIPTFAAKLLGNNKALIGGSAAFAGPDSTAHIGTLSGMIQDLKIFGLSRDQSVDSNTNPSAIFVAKNLGVLENIDATIFGNFQANAAGLVGENSTTGKIKNVALNSTLSGTNNYASLAYSNNGIIQDTRINGRLNCNTASCNNVAGVALNNTGEMSRVRLSLFIHDLANPTNDFSTLSQFNTGTIQDISVEKYSQIQLRGSNAYYFTENNSGTIKRVINSSNLITYGALPSDPYPVGFPTNTDITGAGTEQDIYFGGNSGKQIFSYQYFSCDSANEITIANWPAMYSSWDTHLASYDSLDPSDKKLVIEFEIDGNRYKHQVTNFNAAGKFTVLANCPALSTGYASLYWTNHLPVLPGTTTAAVGVLLPQYPFPLTGEWASRTWDSNNPAHMTEMLSYFSYMIGLSPTPVTPRAWEYEDGEMKLFRMD